MSYHNDANNACSIFYDSGKNADESWHWLTLPIVNGYVLPVVIKSLFHVPSSVPMDVGHLPLLGRLSGTLCPRTCGIRRFLRTVRGSVFQRIGCFFNENALYKSTFDI